MLESISSITSNMNSALSNLCTSNESCKEQNIQADQTELILQTFFNTRVEQKSPNIADTTQSLITESQQVNQTNSGIREDVWFSLVWSPFT